MRAVRVTVQVAIAAGLSALGVGAATAGVVAGSGGRTPAGTVSQKLAYVTTELGVVNADGSGRKRLTSCNPSVCQMSGLAWSPAGARIAFGRGRPHTAMSLFVINIDGSRLKRIAHCGNECDRPSWKPDGSAITFATGSSVFVVSTRTAKVRRLTQCAATCWDFSPVWSRSGRIRFARWGSTSKSGTTLYELDPAHASTLTELARLPWRAANVAWSPDRTRIAFDVFEGGSNFTYVAGADGSDATVVASGASGSGPGMPSWAPDGNSIAYFNTPRAVNGFFEPEVWTVRRDGAARRRLFHADCCVFNWAAPLWFADGTEVAFAYSGPVGGPASRTYAGGTFLLRTDGSRVSRLGDAVSELAPQPARR